MTGKREKISLVNFSSSSLLITEDSLSQLNKDPKNAAAWKVDVIFEDVFAASAVVILLIPNAVLKDVRAMVVPKKAESYPKVNAPHAVVVTGRMFSDE